MRGIIIAASALAVSMGANAATKTKSNVSAFDNFYAELNGGYAMPAKTKFTQPANGKVKFKNPMFLGAAVKTDVMENVKVGVSTGFRTVKSKDRNIVDSAKVRVVPVMLTASYELNGLNDSFVPYVEAGVGIANKNVKVKNGSNNYTIKSNKFAYEAGVGTKYVLSDNTRLGLGLKHSNFGKIKKDNNVKAKDLTSNDIVASVEFKF